MNGELMNWVKDQLIEYADCRDELDPEKMAEEIVEKVRKKPTEKFCPILSINNEYRQCVPDRCGAVRCCYPPIVIEGAPPSEILKWK